MKGNQPELERGRICHLLQADGSWGYPAFRIVNTAGLDDSVPWVTVVRMGTQERFDIQASGVIPVVQEPTRAQLRRHQRRLAGLPRPQHLQAV